MFIKRSVIILLMISTVSLFASSMGAKLFKKCSTCHGVNAQKRSLGVSKVIAGWPASKIIKELKEYRDGNKDQYGFGKLMRGQATKLSDSEIVAVAKYIQTLKPERVNKMKEKRISAEEARYNAFIKDYFQKNRNGTTKEAKMLWKKHLLQNGQ